MTKWRDVDKGFCKPKLTMRKVKVRDDEPRNIKLKMIRVRVMNQGACMFEVKRFSFE